MNIDNVDISTYWVPGNADIPQNEMADQLTKVVYARHASTSTVNQNTTMSKAYKAIKDRTLCRLNKR